jgi:hypothetical protein
MIKDIENNYAFVHLPCNAGSTVEYWLMQMNKHPNWKDRFQWVVPSTGRIFATDDGHVDIPVHDNYQDQLAELEKVPGPLRMHMAAKANDDPNLKLYCIIRNPWERELTSWFHMTKWFNDKSRPEITSGIPEGKLDTFENWITWKYVEIDAKKMMEAGLLENYFSAALLRTDNGDNYNYTHDDAGNDLIDTYIRYENLQEDWNAFAQKVGYPADIFKVKINSNRKSEYNDKHYSYFYNDAIREILDPYCQRDCQRFGYEFETVD